MASDSARTRPAPATMLIAVIVPAPGRSISPSTHQVAASWTCSRAPRIATPVAPARPRSGEAIGFCPVPSDGAMSRPLQYTVRAPAAHCSRWCGRCRSGSSASRILPSRHRRMSYKVGVSIRRHATFVFAIRAHARRADARVAKSGVRSTKQSFSNFSPIEKFPVDGLVDLTATSTWRFVEAGKVASAGGPTSGIDLALRVVERYFGRAAARNTAYAPAYQGVGWLDPAANHAYARHRRSTAMHPLCACAAWTSRRRRRPRPSGAAAAMTFACRRTGMPSLRGQAGIFRRRPAARRRMVPARSEPRTRAATCHLLR